MYSKQNPMQNEGEILYGWFGFITNCHIYFGSPTDKVFFATLWDLQWPVLPNFIVKSRLSLLAYVFLTYNRGCWAWFFATDWEPRFLDEKLILTPGILFVILNNLCYSIQFALIYAQVVLSSFILLSYRFIHDFCQVHSGSASPVLLNLVSEFRFLLRFIHF